MRNVQIAAFLRNALQLVDGAITLEISDAQPEPSVRPDITPDPHLRFAEMRERTTLSYGVFSVTRDQAGGVTLHATWPGRSQEIVEQG